MAGFSDIITTFSNPTPSHASLTTASIVNCDSSSRSPSPWHAVSSSPSDISYEALLLQIGIDPNGPRTNFINEPPLPPDLASLDNFLNHNSKRRQRASKRRRKAAARLAQMVASASEATSSTSTWSGNCDASLNLLTEQKSEEAVTTPLGGGASSRSRRKRWKRRHRH